VILGKLVGAEIIVFLSFVLSTVSGFCVNPILACDPTRATGIGAISFTDGNGNPVHITSVSPKEATSATPAYCEVKGYRWPLDLFIIALPNSWMGRYWQTGNGGAAGALGRITTGISRGYLSASGSGGHDVSQEAGLSDFQVFYPPDDPVAKAKLSDYCFGSVHLTKLLALDMIKAYYGADKKPTYSYYNSCSTGGRQGLIEAQRYPKDFDGLVIGAPAHYFSTGVQGRVWESQVLTSDPWTATGSSLAPKLPLLAAKVMGKCDGIDGLVDGVIDDPRKCDFSPLADLPSCAGTADGTDCFTSNQRNIVKKMYDGPPGLCYDSSYPRWAYGSEEMVPGTTLRSNWAGGNVPISISPRGGWIQWVSLPMSGKGGPGWDWTTYGWTNGDPQHVAANTSAICDAVNPNLSVLKGMGGKIIHYTGWADNSTGAFSTTKYYDAVLSLMGSANTKSFYKLYMVPGMGHCGGALGCGTVDWQTYIENWVEKGQEPGTIIGSRAAAGDPANPPNYMTARTRPLCPYPQAARYLGTGSIDQAASFACAEIVNANVTIKPGELSLSNADLTTFTALIELPHQEDWRATSAVCEGALAISLTRDGHSYKATFNKQDLKNITSGDKVAFTVTLFVERQGNHYGKPDSVPIVFEGRDAVKILK
jgi:hypothetical protein